GGAGAAGRLVPRGIDRDHYDAPQCGGGSERGEHIFCHGERQSRLELQRNRVSEPLLRLCGFLDRDDGPDVPGVHADAPAVSMRAVQSESANLSTSRASCSRSASVVIRVAALASLTPQSEAVPASL